MNIHIALNELDEFKKKKKTWEEDTMLGKRIQEELKLRSRY